MLTWQDIPGYFDFNNIYAKTVADAPAEGARFVEIGILFGRSTLFMAEEIRKSGKTIVFDAVDRMMDPTKVDWRNEFTRLVPALPEVSRQAALDVIDKAKEPVDVFNAYLAGSGLGQYVNLHIESGQQHASFCEDESLDFVFIDANHAYADTKELILAYLPKVKMGGVIAGHDYLPDWPGVIQAVNELFWNKFKLNCSSWIVRKQGTPRRLYLPW